MQYSLLIDQARSVDWGLNLPEATLFCVVFNAPHWAVETIKGTQVWYWIANAKLAAELPLLTSKPDTIKRLMASLQKKGLINRTTDGLRTYIQITAKGKQWNSKEGREINPDLGGKNIPTKAGNKSPRLDNHISDNQDHTPTPIGEDAVRTTAKAKAQAIVDLYNDVCGDQLAKAIALNPKRQRQIENVCKIRLNNGKTPFANYNLKAWRAYFELILENKWNLGENPSNWKADIDYAIRPDTVIKTLERKYA